MGKDLDKIKNNQSPFRKIRITPENLEYLGEVVSQEEVVDAEVDENTTVIHTENSRFPVHRFRVRNSQPSQKELTLGEEQ